MHHISKSIYLYQIKLAYSFSAAQNLSEKHLHTQINIIAIRQSKDVKIPKLQASPDLAGSPVSTR